MLSGTAINAKAQSWQIGVRSGISSLSNIVSPLNKPSYIPQQEAKHVMENEVFARNQRKAFAFDYSLSLYKTSHHEAGYSMVWDAPSYFYSMDITANHLNLGFSLQYDVLSLVTRNQQSKAKCYLGLNLGLEGKSFNTKGINVLDLDAKPVRTYQYQSTSIYASAGSTIYFSYSFNKYLDINGSTAFNINDRAISQVYSYFPHFSNYDSRLSFKVGVGYKL